MATQQQRDPTQTIVLRRRYGQAFGKRLAVLRKALAVYLQQPADPLGLRVPFRTETETETLARFAAWLTPQIEQDFLQIANTQGVRVREISTWHEPFITQGFRRGGVHARVQAAALSPLPPPPTGVPILQAATPFRLNNLVTQAFIGVPGDPTHPGLLNIQGALEQGLSADLLESIRLFENPSETAVRLGQRVRQIARVNARRVASTQIVGAHAEGALEGYASFGLTANVRALIEFTTAGDARVCPICVALSETDRFGLGAGIFPLDQAEGVIPVHALCRCGWTPASVVASDESIAA